MNKPIRREFDERLTAIESARRRLDELVATALLLVRQADEERQRLAALIERLNHIREQ